MSKGFNYGPIHIEGERPEDRNTQFHKRIINIKPIPNTKSGHYAELECGHLVMTFGDLKLTGGVAFCMQCRVDVAD